MIAHNPLQGSGQAARPHPALALGEDAYASQGIGMTDSRRRQPARDEAPHLTPGLDPHDEHVMKIDVTRLNTRPARSAVNALTPFLRTAPHDSGPMWVAVPHSYDFCNRHTSPV